MIRPETGGIGRYTRQLLKEILKLDQTNQYFLLTTPLDREEAQKFKAKNLKIIEIDALHFTLAEQTKLWLFLNKFRFDLVHFTNFNHPIFYHRPFLMTIHDLTMIKFPVGKKQQSMLYSLF
jgi:hypothetical protein